MARTPKISDAVVKAAIAKMPLNKKMVVPTLEELKRRQIAANIDDELAEEMAKCYLDPYRFVVIAFNWGEGDLDKWKGPDEWQTAALLSVRDELARTRGDPVLCDDPLFYATKAGHGVGKSAFTAWIVLWLMCTRPQCVGVVTANTKEQLMRKTWRELGIWHDRLIVKHWFKYNATSFHHIADEKWRCDAIPWSDHNSEAFAGMHNGGRGQFMVFDEASGISDKIYEVAEGAMSDPDAFWFLFGNPTKRSGRFYDAFHRFAKRWKRFTVDARKALAANKRRLQEIIEDWGIDSDYARVRVLGEFPNQDVSTLIPAELLDRALIRTATGCERYRPIWGVDVARQGDDRSVLVKRRWRGLMEPALQWQGLNTMQLAERVRNEWENTEPDDRPSSICVDVIGIGAGVVDRLNEMAAADQLGDTAIIGVNVSESAAVTDMFARLRDELWWKARTWFDKLDCSMLVDRERARSWALEGNEEAIFEEAYSPVAARRPICDELRDILFSYLPNGKIKLEPKLDTKERLGRSPDCADAFVLTFADSDVVLDNDDYGRGRYARKVQRKGSAWAA